MTMNATNKIEALTAEFDRVEDKMWELNMIDRWTQADREKYDELFRYRNRLIDELAKLGAC